MCPSRQVQDLSADLLMHLEVLAFSVGTVSCLLLGTYSDVMGRRLLLLLTVMGHLLRDATVSVVIHWDLGLPALYLGYAVYGLSGATAGRCHSGHFTRRYGLTVATSPFVMA